MLLGIVLFQAMRMPPESLSPEPPNSLAGDQSDHKQLEAPSSIERGDANLGDLDLTPGIEDIDREANEAVMLQILRGEVPKTRFHLERDANIRKETLEQAIANFANFDDFHFAATASGVGYSAGDPNSEMSRIAHTIRVRRVLEHGRAFPEQVTPLLRRALRDSFEQWPQAYKERVELWRNSTEGFNQSEATSYEIVTTQAIVSAYLLAELNDHQSLPLLFDLKKRSAAWTAEYGRGLVYPYPVPTTLLYHTIGRLIESYPASQLDEESLAHRQVYIDWTKQHLPPGRTMTASTWSGDTDTTDPAVGFIDPAVLIRENSETIDLVLYPHLYTNGDQIENGRGFLDDRGKTWEKLIDNFVNSLD